jgi:hypothetical protein
MKFLILLVLFACTSLENKPIELPPGQMYLVKSYGQIHKSCLNNFGSKLVNVIDASVAEGLHCLRELKGAGAKKNAKLFSNLYGSGKLSFICHEDDYPWGSSDAHGSFSKAFDMPKYQTYHPYISFRPDLVLKDSRYKGKATHPDILKEIIFHELIHDIGYLHFKDPEYPYACQSCCFQYGPEKAEACRICETEYKSIADPGYMKALWNWAPKNYAFKAISRQRVLRNAIYISKGKHQFFDYLAEDYIFGNLPIRLLLKEAARRGYPLNARTERSLIIEHGLLTLDVQKFSADVAKAGTTIFLDKNLKKGLNLYLELDPAPLGKAMKNPGRDERVALLNIWDSTLWDLDFLLGMYYKKEPEYSRILKQFEVIYKFLPKQKE